MGHFIFVQDADPINPGYHPHMERFRGLADMQIDRFLKWKNAQAKAANPFAATITKADLIGVLESGTGFIYSGNAVGIKDLYANHNGDEYAGLIKAEEVNGGVVRGWEFPSTCIETITSSDEELCKFLNHKSPDGHHVMREIWLETMKLLIQQ